MLHICTTLVFFGISKKYLFWWWRGGRRSNFFRFYTENIEFPSKKKKLWGVITPFYKFNPGINFLLGIIHVIIPIDWNVYFCPCVILVLLVSDDLSSWRRNLSKLCVRRMRTILSGGPKIFPPSNKNLVLSVKVSTFSQFQLYRDLYLRCPNVHNIT